MAAIQINIPKICHHKQVKLKARFLSILSNSNHTTSFSSTKPFNLILPIKQNPIHKKTIQSRSYSVGVEAETVMESRKMRVLCLHGFRTSGAILQRPISKWPKEVHDQFDFVCVDAPFPAQGKSEVEGIFDPPYFEWVFFDKEKKEFGKFEETLAYIEECSVKHGPIDGLLGFSQGAELVAALPGFQEQGLALTKVPKIKFVIIISGRKIRLEELSVKAYANLVSIPNLHFLGKEDFMRPHGLELLECYKNPIVIHHPKSHVVPRIAPESLSLVLDFIDQAKKVVLEDEN